MWEKTASERFSTQIHTQGSVARLKRFYAVLVKQSTFTTISFINRTVVEDCPIYAT